MGRSGIGWAAQHGWRKRFVAGSLLLLLTVTAASQADAKQEKGIGKRTLIQRIVEGKQFGDVVDSGEEPFFQLKTGPGEPFIRREDLAEAEGGRGDRRRSLAYFAQLTDFQLADEESPARVEFLDSDPSGTARSSWRPQEAFHPFAIDESLREVNSLATSPVRQGNGKSAKLHSAILTGDQADNQQFNETLWVRQLIEPGSSLDPGSGVNNYGAGGCDAVAQTALRQKNLDNEPNYVGVQDYEDFRRQEDYYDPDEPAGEFSNWPRYHGLMDRAQEPFITTGLKVPTYVVNGNHDSLMQGNEDANKAFEDIATGCFKVAASTSPSTLPVPDLGHLLTPAAGEFVPPDPKRRIVSKGEIRNIFSDGKQKDDHGFAFVDPEEDGPGAANGTAWYYAWNPKPGLRFIAIDTVSEGGNVQDSSEGNIDNPQFQWLRRELERASEKGKLIVLFGHHPVRSLISETPDENAPQCAGGYNEDGEYVGPDRDTQPRHNHAVNPGCDADDRPSTPLHHGDDLVELLHEFPHAIAYVPGHTHENRVTPFPDGDGGGFWELNTSAVADWPQQHRLIDLMDNRDGTLSIFSFVADHESHIGIPEPGRANPFSRRDLGALGRTFSFNDPQSERHEGSEGDPEDRNVELLIDDPRDDEQQQTAPRQSTSGGEDEPPIDMEVPSGGELPPLPDVGL